MPDYDPKSIPILDDVIEADILEQENPDSKHKDPVADIPDTDDESTDTANSIGLFSTAPVELSPEDVIIDDIDSEDLDSGDSGPAIGAIDTLEDGINFRNSDFSNSDEIATEEENSEIVEKTDQGFVDIDTLGSAPLSSAPLNSTPDDSQAIDLETEDQEAEDQETVESALIGYRADTIEGAEEDNKAYKATDYADTGSDTFCNTESDDQTETTGPSLCEAVAQQSEAVLSLDKIVDDVVTDIVGQLLPDLEQQLRYLVQQALEDRLPAEIINQLHTSADKDKH